MVPPKPHASLGPNCPIWQSSLPHPDADAGDADIRLAFLRSKFPKCQRLREGGMCWECMSEVLPAVRR